MSEFLSVLSNIRSIRATTRQISISDLEEGIEKLMVVLEERKEEESSKAAEKEEKNRKIREVLEKMEALGISREEILGNASTGAAKGDAREKSKRNPRPPKFEFMEDGIMKTWTGQGRQPRPIKEAIASGEKTLQDFEIKQ